MLRVLIADDSPLAREMLSELINDDPGMMVAGVACGGKETIRKASELRPSLITMDFLMPDMNGVEATRHVMTSCPTPIVVISSAVSSVAGPTHFDALSAGAVDVLEKPDFHELRADPGRRRRFLENLRSMSSVVTVTRRAQGELARDRPRRADAPSPDAVGPDVVVVGASTGGPPAVARVLATRRPLVAPVVIVQHMASGFIGGYAEWLAQQIGRPVRLATNGGKLEPGITYVAPDGHHVEVTSFHRLLVHQGLPLRHHRPSVDVLFQSAATNYGSRAIGVLLTGMGEDGARGLHAMRREGAFTIAQNEESSVVYGMPGAAAARGAVTWSGDPAAIAEYLSESTASRPPNGGHPS